MNLEEYCINAAANLSGRMVYSRRKCEHAQLQVVPALINHGLAE